MSVFLLQVPQWLPMSFTGTSQTCAQSRLQGCRSRRPPSGHPCCQQSWLRSKRSTHTLSFLLGPRCENTWAPVTIWSMSTAALKPLLVCTLPTAPHLTPLPRSLFLLIGPKRTVPLAASRLFLTPVTPLLSPLLPSCQFSPHFKNQSFTNSYFVKLWISVSKSNL